MSQSCVRELRSRPGSQLSMKIGKHKKDIDSTTDFNTYGAPSSSVRIQKYTGKRVIGSGKSGSKQSCHAYQADSRSFCMRYEVATVVSGTVCWCLFSVDRLKMSSFG